MEAKWVARYVSLCHLTNHLPVWFSIPTSRPPHASTKYPGFYLPYSLLPPKASSIYNQLHLNLKFLRPNKRCHFSCAVYFPSLCIRAGPWLVCRLQYSVILRPKVWCSLFQWQSAGQNEPGYSQHQPANIQDKPANTPPRVPAGAAASGWLPARAQHRIMIKSNVV